MMQTRKMERSPGAESNSISRRRVFGLGLAAAGWAAGAAHGLAEEQGLTATEGGIFEVTEINHVALRVTDLDRSEAFYREVLGFTTLRRLRSARFMACGPHFVALFRSSSPGLHHLAFSWPAYTQAEAVSRLEAAGLEARTQENRTYFSDPDGIELQLSWNQDWPGQSPRPGTR